MSSLRWPAARGAAAVAFVSLASATAPFAGGCTLGIAACGNGAVDPGEQCEPPGEGGCADDCTILVATCGDAIISPGEQCDPPDGVVCDPTCRLMGGPGTPVCGNGVVETGEQCEPPGTATCSASCDNLTPGPSCGNGVVETGEQCDPPNGSTCSSGCTLVSAGPVCGNGVVEAGEQCDPPDGWTCDFGCRWSTGPTPYCGDGWVDWPETCDPPDGVTCDWSCNVISGGGTAGPGEPCTWSADCAAPPGLAAVCLDEASTGLPGGFCLVEGCSRFSGTDDCPTGSQCVGFDDGLGGSIDICLPNCDPTAGGLGGCRTATGTDYGYACYPDLVNPAAGYCWVGCTTSALCNWCDTTTGTCSDGATSCASDVDCAAAGNFACHTSLHLCYPDHAPGPAAIGAPCTTLLDCPANAWCESDATDWPGGYCIQTYCGSFSDPEFACPAGAVCPAASGGAANLCAASCTVDGGNASCDTDRGDTNDYECNDLAVPAGAPAADYYAATGNPGYCLQCEVLVSGAAGCP